MSAGTRTFGALVAHDSVCLVEYRAERTGIHVVDQWTAAERSSSIDEALTRLVGLVTARDAGRARLSLAIEQFGVVHHVMTLPKAADEVLRPVIVREVQRVFGIPDPVVAFARGALNERREPSRADVRTAPRQLFVAAAPPETIDALHEALSGERFEIEIATVVPKAIHSLYQASASSLEPTSVLVCLEGGPHLAFFLDGRLEVSIDPPIALEGERAPVAAILDQVERGAVYFRQQFRGATASRMLLSAPASEYDALASALEARLSVRVSPLYTGTTSPEAAVAMGAVLEARHESPLDLYPHPPSLSQRAAATMTVPNAFVAAAAAAAVIAGIWFAAQFATLSSTHRQSDALRSALRAGVSALEPMRQIAERRAGYASAVEFVTNTRGERAMLTGTLAEITEQAPAGVRFDSLRVARTVGGWAASIAGQTAGGTAAQAVRSLDLFFQTVKGRPGISTPNLDQFDYPAPPVADSIRHSDGPVLIQFRLSFAIDRGAGAGRGGAH